MMIRAARLTMTTMLLGAAVLAQAEVYPLPPPGNDVVGAVTTIQARAADTLIDIGRRHGVGYEEIVRANPDVDVWLPGEGTRIVLPTRYILPQGPRRGVVLNLAEYRLYYFPEPSAGEPAVVMTYPVSIGRMDWATPLGETRIVSKVVDPAWYPPESVRKEHADQGRPLPRIVPPGPDNPMGNRAIRLALPGYLIHGTNRPAGVGMRVTHGCIRMYPEDIEFLFARVAVDTPVRIINKPVKVGWDGERLLVEAHRTLEVAPTVPDEEQAAVAIDTIDTGAEALPIEPPAPSRLTVLTEQFIAATDTRAGQLDWGLAERLLERADGIPAVVGNAVTIKNAATSAASE